MKCIICHGQHFENNLVHEELRIENDIILVPIEANVCQTCGERYFTRQAMKQVELIEQQIARHERPLKEVGKVLVAG